MEVSGQLHVPAALPPEKNAGTRSMKGWVDPTARLHVLENRKISCP